MSPEVFRLCRQQIRPRTVDHFPHHAHEVAFVMTHRKALEIINAQSGNVITDLIRTPWGRDVTEITFRKALPRTVWDFMSRPLN